MKDNVVSVAGSYLKQQRESAPQEDPDDPSQGPVKKLRKEKNLTQAQLAELMRSSQSRVAKVEAADESVSLDLLIRSLLALGASHQDLARWIATSTPV